jgi:copper chaperone CopZ
MNKQVTLKVTGMHCGGCVASVEKSLKSLAGVANASVNLKEGQATVYYDPGKTNEKDMVKAIKNAGFGAG